MMNVLRVSLANLIFGFSLLQASTFVWADESVGFNRDILPILAERCFACHGFDNATRKAGLRLDSAAGATTRLSSGLSAIFPGKPTESELFRRIASTDPDEVMPPPNTGKPLSVRERQLIEIWINQGAQYESHWAYLPPRRIEPPSIPEIPFPIDRFVYLPSTYRGVTFRNSSDPILFLSNPRGITTQTQRARLDAMRDLNQRHQKSTGDTETASRIESYELAFRMQMAAPELLDFRQETAATRAMYGLDTEKTRPFGNNCLLARRMIERGVRFIQLFHSTWDDHSNLNEYLKTNCDMTDLPTAGLLQDLKQRGLLDDTLIVWAGEFGRTPMGEVRRGSSAGKEGRDHHPFAFSAWMAGGGVKRGHIHGRTDDFGYHVAESPVHVHDLQATILNLLGIDHERLTYRHSGRDFRLTDVAGKVVSEILA